ncbi:aegerolysin type hemolysin [Xylariomycetidae sp. FL0641]|nr:aegerolysin type hemolysin [Xylariomycetidae sp. FL0641]
MAYAQWVYMLIQNKIKSGDLKVKNVVLNWGKFYKWSNKDDEVSVADTEGKTISAGSDGGIASCGRSDASSGCEGSYDLYNGETKVCHVYFSCPWGSKTNTLNVTEIPDSYIVQASGQNLDSGALGSVNIKVAKLD